MADRSYGLNDVPPPGVLLPAALQHIGLGAVTLVFPLLVAEAAGADARTTAQYLSLAMLALGVATLLQAFGRFGIGSGFLLPAVFTAIHLPVALVAARVGGLGAVAGLMLVAGLVEMLLSRVVHRLRPFLPAEIVGLVVLVLGILLGLLSLRLMLGVSQAGGVDGAVLPGSLAALAVIVGLAVWAPPRVRVLAVLGGIAAGSPVSALASLADGGPSAVAGIALVPPAWPLSVPSLELVLLPGALIGATACFVRAIGDIVASQRATDLHWKRPDYATIRAGTLADGMGTFAAGLLGTIGVNTYSASVGLAIATGVLARRVALAVGAG